MSESTPGADAGTEFDPGARTEAPPEETAESVTETDFEPVELADGSVISVRNSHVEIGYSADPNVPGPRKEYGPQVVVTTPSGDVRSVDAEDIGHAQAMAEFVIAFKTLFPGR